MCMEYLFASSNLYAHVFGVEVIRNRSLFSETVEKLDSKGWQLGGRPTIERKTSNDEGKSGDVSGDPDDLNHLKESLKSIDVTSLIKAHPHDFEKDDDSNFHIDYLTAATNLRAWNYSIKASERDTVKSQRETSLLRWQRRQAWSVD